MKYHIVGIRYENDVNLLPVEYAVSSNKLYAQAIVDALNANFSELYHFGIIEEKD